MKKFPFLSRVQHHPLFTLVFFIAFGLVVSFVSVFAVPPATKYDPGATLDPTCAPGDTNCSVAVGTVTQSSGTQTDGYIPYWTSNDRELFIGGSQFQWDANRRRLGINTNSGPTATLDVADNGDYENDIFRIAGATSTVGDSAGISISLGTALAQNGVGQTGYDGGAISFLSGRGGAGDVSGGLGGNVTIGAHKGGNASSGVGGVGGGVVINAGGAGNSANSANGGNGGSISLNGGAPTTGESVGGAGGTITLTSGAGGDIANGAGATAASGAHILLTSGNGGSAPSGSTNGNGGNIILAPGVAGTGGGSSGSIGNVLLAVSGGNVGVGITSPLYRLHVKGDNGAGVVAKFETSGGATACTLSATTGLLNCSSDSRLKKDIENIGSVLDKMLALRPVSYRWNTEDSDAPLKYGFIAQEVEEQFPATVTTDEESGYKLFSLQGLIPYIVKSLKELNDKVDSISGNISSQVTQVVQSIMPSLTVGSAEAPTGITLFDKTTTEPHCLSINNGIIETTPGACQ